MIIEQSEQVMKEIKKVFIGKDEIIEKVLMAIYAGGHILLEDAPGVGKTTLALLFQEHLGFLTNVSSLHRIPCLPILPDSVYTIKNTGELEYKPGAADCHLLLGDEINRTSPKTQAALLEVMEEGSVYCRWYYPCASEAIYLYCHTESLRNCRNSGTAGISDGPFMVRFKHWLSGERQSGTDSEKQKRQWRYGSGENENESG